MDIYLRRDLVNLKREYQEVRQIVIFIVKTQCREPEVLQLVCSSLLKQGQDLALSKNAGEQMVRVGYSRELSISWVMETFCGLSVMTVTTSTYQFIMTCEDQRPGRTRRDQAVHGGSRPETGICQVITLTRTRTNTELFLFFVEFK